MAGQHSDHSYVLLMHMGIKVVAPSMPFDMKGLMVAAIREDDPVAVFASAAMLPVRGDVPEELYALPLGEGQRRREGTDVTVVAVGHLVPTALEVADQISEGIRVLVWDPRTLLPLDKRGLCSAVSRTGRAVVRSPACIQILLDPAGTWCLVPCDAERSTLR